MYNKKLARYKPGVTRQIHLLLAAILWTCVGLLLLLRGCNYLEFKREWWLLVMALLAGGCKSLFVLDRTAKKGIKRILTFSDGTCIGAVYSLKTWMLVLVMIAGGYVLRTLGLPHNFLAFVFFTVGGALLFSSRHAWMAWKTLLTQKKQ